MTTQRITRKTTSSATRRLARLFLALIYLLGSYGCFPPVPIPWKAEPPRYSAETLASIRTGVSRHEDVAKLLGPPDMIRQTQRDWVYSWARGHGKLLLYGDPVYLDRFTLFLAFDANGLLVSKEMGTTVAHSDDAMCSTDGKCVSHLVHVGYSSGGALIYALVDQMSAFTMRSPPGDLSSGFPGTGNICRIRITLDMSWTESLPWYITKPRFGARLSIGDLDSVWLPSEAFVEMYLAPGDYSLTARWWERDLSATGDAFAGPSGKFTCISGSTLNLVVGGAFQGKEVGMTVTEIDPESGQARLSGRPQVLLPDRI